MAKMYLAWLVMLFGCFESVNCACYTSAVCDGKPTWMEVAQNCYAHAQESFEKLAEKLQGDVEDVRAKLRVIEESVNISATVATSPEQTTTKVHLSETSSVAGKWSEWGPFGECSEWLCEVPGEQTSTRTCSGGSCSGPETRTQVCNNHTVQLKHTCMALALSPSIQKSQAQFVCQEIYKGNRAIRDKLAFDAIVKKMRATNSNGMTIWLSNSYTTMGKLEYFSGSVIPWLGGVAPADPGTSNFNVRLVTTPSDAGLQVDFDGTATADGALCGK